MPWDSGELSLIVSTEKRKMNRVMVSYEVDHANHRVLKEMLNHANGVSEDLALELPTMTLERESVADTEATVVCVGTELMQGMGLKLNQLLPTNLTLFTADKKSLTSDSARSCAHHHLR
jgi:hypothetical protein